MVKKIGISILVAFFALTNEAQQVLRKIGFDADIMEVSKYIAPDAKRLIGNVMFKHEGVIMYCDSAYFYAECNALDAFSHVYINKGDTLHLYADTVRYDGNTKMAKSRSNVKFIKKETTLYTNYLDFDMNTNTGYYQNKGKIVNTKDTLYSTIGHYYANEDIFHFKDSVKIVAPDYTIYADTMHYQAITKTAYFYGPTHILSDSNYIYGELGWYNTQSDISKINKNAFLKRKAQTLRGDTILYNRNTGNGEAFNNVDLYDSVEKVILRGRYGMYNEISQSALMTDSAHFIQISEKETGVLDSLFVHGDTLRSAKDSSGLYKVIRVYYRVKIFKSDLQGMCDSLTYTEKDSVMRFYTEPILWSEENQITADFIELYMGKNRADSIKMYNNAFIISCEDSVRFNQIKGKLMTGYFRNNELYIINVKGNGETIYYAKDEDDIIGVNKAVSTDLVICLQEKKVKRIKFITSPEATFFPLDQVAMEDLILKGFLWQDKHRPRSKMQIFTWTK